MADISIVPSLVGVTGAAVAAKLPCAGTVSAPATGGGAGGLEGLSVGQRHSCAGGSEGHCHHVALVGATHAAHTVGVRGHGGQTGEGDGGGGDILQQGGCTIGNGVHIVAGGIAGPGQRGTVGDDIAGGQGSGGQTRRSRIEDHVVNTYTVAVMVGISKAI